MADQPPVTGSATDGRSGTEPAGPDGDRDRDPSGSDRAEPERAARDPGFGGPGGDGAGGDEAQPAPDRAGRERAGRERAGRDGATGGPGGHAAGDCDAHQGLGVELRALALAALDRLEPALQRIRAEPTGAPATTCANCPVCAVIALLRGERPELTGRLAEQLGGLLAVLRTALEEGDPASAPTGPPAETAAPAGAGGRRVQRIPVERVAP